MSLFPPPLRRLSHDLDLQGHELRRALRVWFVSAGGVEDANLERAGADSIWPGTGDELELQFSGTDPGSVLARSTIETLIGAAAPNAHKTTHQNGGADEISIASLAGVASDRQKAIPASYVRVQDEKAAGTPGGAFNNGAWRTRDLNVKSDDPDAIASLASNEVTLPSGTYLVRISAPAFKVNGHQIRLYNVTDAGVELVGVSAISGGSDSCQTRSWIQGLITLGASKALRVEHQCNTTRPGDGLGDEANVGATETYAVAEFWRLL